MTGQRERDNLQWDKHFQFYNACYASDTSNFPGKASDFSRKSMKKYL
jgi:hypothetical protein